MSNIVQMKKFIYKKNLSLTDKNILMSKEYAL